MTSTSASPPAFRPPASSWAVPQIPEVSLAMKACRCPAASQNLPPTAHVPPGSQDTVHPPADWTSLMPGIRWVLPHTPFVSTEASTCAVSEASLEPMTKVQLPDDAHATFGKVMPGPVPV